MPKNLTDEDRANWHAAAAIIDEKKAAKVYVRWILNPPQRKLPNGNGHTSGAVKPLPPITRTPLLAPTEAAAATPMSALSPRVLSALKVLWAEGVL